MGQQQLLLLVLGIVIVGLAVVGGIQAFEENRRQFRQDQTVHFLTDLGTKAQLWKLRPASLGGGADGTDNDFSAFKLEAVGYAPTEMHGAQEVLYRTDYACLKLFPGTTDLTVNALNTDCVNGSWWMQMRVTGLTEDDITIVMNSDRSAISGNGQ